MSLFDSFPQQRGGVPTRLAARIENATLMGGADSSYSGSDT
jgi:hypothetical protein